MDMKKCANLIAGKIDEIMEIYMQYNPSGEILHISAVGDYITAFNNYWKEDEEHPLDFFRLEKKDKIEITHHNCNEGKQI